MLRGYVWYTKHFYYCPQYYFSPLYQKVFWNVKREVGRRKGWVGVPSGRRRLLHSVILVSRERTINELFVSEGRRVQLSLFPQTWLVLGVRTTTSKSNSHYVESPHSLPKLETSFTLSLSLSLSLCFSFFLSVIGPVLSLSTSPGLRLFS